MANFPILERIIWFDRQVRGHRYPNANDMARHFEVAVRTARRTIDFMRDRMGAPLQYDSEKRGYFYDDRSFELTPFQVTQEEILAILVAQKLLSTTAGGLISRSIRRFGNKLFQTIGKVGLAQKEIQRKFSASWHGHCPAEAAVFRQVARAVLKARPIRFSYQSPAMENLTHRTVQPHHLQYYLASWVLIAWCRERQDWRKFYLSRMSDLTVTDENFTPRPEKDWKHLVDNAFGIFQSKHTRRVTLRFNRFRSRWVKDQIWHARQKMNMDPQGRVILTIPVSDFREIKLEVLKYGADVEVLAPDSFRQEVMEEIKKMGRIYGKFQKTV